MFRLRLFIVILLATGCAQAKPRVDQWRDTDYQLTVKDVPEAGLTAFTYEGIVDAPAWRLWNTINDLDVIYNLTPGFSKVGEVVLDQPGMVRMTMRVNPRWYLPSLMAHMKGRLAKGELAWDCQCESGGISECYVRFSVVPLTGGTRSLFRTTGYFKRPWYVTYAMTVDYLADNTRQFNASIGYRIQQPKYGQPDASYPWLDVNSLAGGAAPAKAAPEKSERRPRLAVHPIEGYGLPASGSVLVTLAGDYMAYSLARDKHFDVVTQDDLRLIMRYLGDNWAVLCGSAKSDECDKRLAKSANADYLLTGRLEGHDADFSLHLVMLDPLKGSEVWRWQGVVKPTVEGIRVALDQAIAALETTALQ